MTNPSPVIIVGGGWAGLAAAVELCRRNIPVAVLEAAKQLGGRARRIAFNISGNGSTPLPSSNRPTAADNEITRVDNGQHLLLGAYESTLSIMRDAGVPLESVLLRKNMQLFMRHPTQSNVRITPGKLPAPLHLASGLLLAAGLSFNEKRLALHFCRAMLRQQFTLPRDESCLQLLTRYKQTDRLIQFIWQPLCLAALNTHLESASAQVFLRVLREAFTHGRRDSDFLYTATDLSAVFPDAAMEFIERNNGRVKLAHRVAGLSLSKDHVIAVSDEHGEVIEGAAVILATPIGVTQKLLAAHEVLSPLARQLNQFESKPICTVYLQYDSKAYLETEMVGFVGTTSQWAFDRRVNRQPGLIAVVISGSGNHMKKDNRALIAEISAELANFYPAWPAPRQAMVVREKRATFHCTVDCDTFRPDNQTPVKGLWLAGDYTNTGLPATLESAVRSGIRSAAAIAAGQASAG